MRRAGRIEWSAWFALVIIASLLLGHGLRIPIEARLGPLLLDRAWAETRERGWGVQPGP